MSPSGVLLQANLALSTKITPHLQRAKLFNLSSHHQNKSPGEKGKKEKQGVFASEIVFVCIRNMLLHVQFMK